MKNAFSCTEALLQSLPQPIAIVANGVLAAPMGPAIDHHPSVIRLDNFRLDGFETIVGTRTTLRCTSVAPGVDPRGEQLEFSPLPRSASEASALAAYEQRSGAPLLCARTDVRALLQPAQNLPTAPALVLLCNQLGLTFSLFGFDGLSGDTLHALKHGVAYVPGQGSASLGQDERADQIDRRSSESLALYRHLGIVIKDESILEFGAGNGDLAAFMQAQGNDVAALEWSPAAFARIPLARKVHGDGLTLAGIGQKFDRFVSVDVLQQLTENDVRLVLREASRLAGAVLVSVSTRLSGVLEPNGEDMHRTVRSAQWWRRLFAEYFEVELMHGLEVGQLVIAGDRRATGAAPAARAAAAPDRFNLPAGYTERAKPDYYADVAGDGRTWQPDVYPTAAEVARSLGCDTLIDIGCGHARKLTALHPEFKLIGVDYGGNMEHCRKQFKFGTWLEADFENVDMLPIPPSVLAKSVVICSDVIEHLVDPRQLMAALRQLLAHAPALVLSTPDRERTWGTTHNGPPPNPAHTREWSLAELSALFAREGFALAAETHTRSNDGSPELATSLLLAVNLEHPRIRGSKLFDAAMAGQNRVVAAAATTSTTASGATRSMPPAAAPVAAVPAAVLPKTGAAVALEAATAAAGAQAMADPAWRERLAQARGDSETLRVLAEMSLTLGHPDRSVDLYGALLSADGSDREAFEGVVLSQMRSGQYAAAARLLASVPTA